LKITEGPNFLRAFTAERNDKSSNFEKKKQLGDFFTSSSGHPGQEPVL
jgi:hypothetical protein